MSLASFSLFLLQQTWVVDDTPGPGVNFTDLPAAVAAAANGDILLVQPGTYSHFAVSGKGLRILGGGTATTVVSNPGATQWKTTISNVPLGSVAYVDRMTFTGAYYEGPRLRLTGSTTRAVLADLVVAGSAWTGAFSPPGAAVLADGVELHLHRCLVYGSGGCSSVTGGCFGALPGVGLLVTNGAHVSVASSDVYGGPGAAASGFSGAAQGGSSGISVAAGGLVPGVWIADSEVLGGPGGGNTMFGNPSPPGPGGSGISAYASSVRVSGDSTSLVRGGNAGCGSPGTASPGPGIVTSSGASVEVHSIPVAGGNACTGIPGPATSGTGISLGATSLPVLRVSGNLSLSGSATVELTNGPPGAPFWLALSATPAFLSAGSLFQGEILLDPTSWFPLFNGNLSGAGDFSVTLPLAGLAPGFVHLPLYLQAIALDPGGAFWRVSNSTVATVRP